MPLLNTYSQFCKTSITLQPAKQGLFSLIPEAAAHMNFAVDFVGFFRTPFHCGNQMQNWCYKKSPKLSRKHLRWSLFLIKLQVSDLKIFKKDFRPGAFMLILGYF